MTTAGNGAHEPSGRDPVDRACYRCGSEEDLIADEHVQGVWICRACLARVDAQNELIRRGIEEEPDVEM